MAVVVGEAAVRIRPDVDEGKFRGEVAKPIGDSLEEAGSDGAARFTAAFGAALAIGGAFAASLESAALGDKLAAQLGATGAEAEQYGAIAGDLYANAYGDSLETVNGALRSVVQNVGGMADASSEDLQAVTGSVLDLATAMDQDVGATSQAVGRLIQTGLAANAEEALDVLTRGFQAGADRGGDLLDVVGEYGTTFSELGLNGSQSIGLLNQALAAGIPNADFAADALREMGIIGREGGEEAAEALDDLGLSSSKYFAAMQAGGPQASAALDQVLDKLRSTEDPAVRASAAAALVGTQYEDLGDAILQLDPSEAVSGLGQIEGAAGRMGTTLNDNASTNLTTFWRTAQTAFVDIVGGQVVPIVETVAALLATTLGPALDGVGTIVTGTIIPAVQGMATWVAENETPITVIAGLIATLFIPHLIALGIQAGITQVRVVGTWIAQSAATIAAAVVHSAQIAWMILRWVAMGAAAILNAGLTVGAWVGMGIAAVLQAGIVAGAWLGAQIRTVLSWALMAAGAAANAIAVGAVWLAQTALTTGALLLGWGVAVAGVVGGWVVMATQSLLQAARMAAAWFIALGPIGWIGLAVAGLVALVVANWETVKSKTAAIWNAVTGAVSGAWSAIQAGVKAGINGVIGLINDFVIGGVNVLIKGVNLVNPFDNIPLVPKIPKLHSGGEFDSGTSAGEGLALLRDGELVATPEQRAVANDLLRGLLAGRVTGPPGSPAGAGGAGAVTIVENVYAAPGQSAAAIAAQTTQGVVWNLNAGIARPAPLPAGA